MVITLSENPKKNIIFITIDSLRADIFFSHILNETSSFVGMLAKKGVVFLNCIANGVGTPAAFPTIFTSTYALMHQKKPDKFGGIRLGPFVTVQELLKKKDFLTIGIHSNFYLSEKYKYDKGFDIFKYMNEVNICSDAHGTRKGPIRVSFTPLKSTMKMLLDNLSRKFAMFCLLRAWLTYRSIGDWDAFYKKFIKMSYVTAEFINKEVNLVLRQMIPKKIFLWVHYMDVHMPYIPPPSIFEEMCEKHEGSFFHFLKVINKLRFNAKSISTEERRWLISLYKLKIRHIDEKIAELMKILEEFGIGRDNSYIILTSDHGEGFGEHDIYGHSGLYEEIIRVPLIIIGPDLKPNCFTQEQVCHLDLAPTMLNLLGITIPKQFMGKSLIPLIFEKTESSNKFRNRIIISEWIARNAIAISCRQPPYKYILTITRSGRRGRIQIYEEFYSLKEDPQERRNLVIVRSKIAKFFKNIILEHLRSEKRYKDRILLKSRIRKIIGDISTSETSSRRKRRVYAAACRHLTV
mgnify:CR=1 FL=1